MDIRKLKISDLEKLHEISIQTFTETFSEANSEEDMQQYISESLNEERLLSELQNNDSEFYFAEEKGKILGYLKLNFRDAQNESFPNDYIEIERIYVIKEFLEKKVGKILFDKVIERACEINADCIWLGVWEKNERAIAFYEKNGFEIVGRHDFVLGEDLQTDLIMKRKI
ncbi:MAG TPA: GNAT family N-acetyltransferase [Chryseobacterium sp.]|nr:GNAT family N-acetyltransferase [Chryseobacterium sp.]